MFLRALPLFGLAVAALAADSFTFTQSGYTVHGVWSATATATPNAWSPGTLVTVRATLTLTGAHLDNLAAAGVNVDGFAFLVTAERTFDPQGRLRLASGERMSTLLTPTGLPIEGGVQGAVTKRYGYRFATPFDQLRTLPLESADRTAEGLTVNFMVQQRLPENLPPGLYRLRLDYGVRVKNRSYSLNGDAFAVRPFFKGQPTVSQQYSPVIPASANDAAGQFVDAAAITPRLPYVLLNNYNSNGCRGVVAAEDQSSFGISGRNLIQEDIVLPLYNDRGQRLAYSLEPQLLSDTLDPGSNIDWDYTSGAWSVRVTGPDGQTAELGTRPFVGNSGLWPTTKYAGFTQWRPAAYGQHTVTASGWILDKSGRRYEAGGTYKFWIAKRMTLATATFQGMPYALGGRYGRDIGFAPAVAADVDVTATLYPASDPAQAKTIRYGGKATPTGMFGAAQGMKPLPFDAPGEYAAHVLARYTDAKGHLWVCSMHHAGVVYPPDSPIAARGKKLIVNGKAMDRGDTRFEGWVDPDGTTHLAHINFPFQPGDVLLIASEGQGANKIEPVLTWDDRAEPKTWDNALNGIGRTNLRLATSNGYSPHLFPEYITTWAYYYAAAPRPGFMSRFIVAEDGVRAPYWPTSPNSFGGQINASYNGDLPGDIYRLIGGVVLRRPGEQPLYAGYVASAFILPANSKDNRVTAPGLEDLLGPYGRKARFFMVGTRPGLTYLTGATFNPAVQIDPIVPATITFRLFYPDGRTVETSGRGDAGGTFVGRTPWVLDVPGVYRYTLEGDWGGNPGVMPGLPPAGGEFYVLEAQRPAGVPEMTLDLPAETVFSPTVGLAITGQSTAGQVYFAAVMPGAVLDQGFLPVAGGKFRYQLDPKKFNNQTNTYDIENRVTGKPEIGDVIHLTFLSKEQAADGTAAYSFKRVIVRGTRAILAP